MQETIGYCLAAIKLTEFHDIWGKKYPHITQSWTNNWNELSTFFKYPEAIKKLIYTTNPIESLNSNIKRRTKNKGSFPTIESAFKMLYLSSHHHIKTIISRSPLPNITTNTNIFLPFMILL